MIDIIATNIQGLGATHVVRSLLPAIERVGGASIGTIWLPDRGTLAGYGDGGPRYRAYRRRLPNAVSRLAECAFMGRRVYGGRALLVLGDLPIRTDREQVLFLHNSAVFPDMPDLTRGEAIKRRIIRGIFRSNLPCVDRFIVQTGVMAQRLAAHYGVARTDIAIVPQPPPAGLARPADAGAMTFVPGDRLRLFFPADAAPYKNHGVLAEAAAAGALDAVLDRIVVTLTPAEYPGAGGKIQALGRLGQDDVLAQYRAAHALVFPSLDESYGLPLVEAMSHGLAIVCADRPYAHALCGEGALYFDPLSAASLRHALAELHRRLAAGWRPDWTEQIRAFPADWDAVARQMLSLFGARQA